MYLFIFIQKTVYLHFIVLRLQSFINYVHKKNNITLEGYYSTKHRILVVLLN